MAALAVANDMRCLPKSLKMAAKGTGVDLPAVDSWEKEITAQSCTRFRGGVTLRNSNKVKLPTFLQKARYVLYPAENAMPSACLRATYRFAACSSLITDHAD